jgi:hypothetical protein
LTLFITELLSLQTWQKRQNVVQSVTLIAGTRKTVGVTLPTTVMFFLLSNVTKAGVSVVISHR